MLFEPNPIAFTLLGLEIRWYGILIALGMILGGLVMYRRGPRYGLDSERLLDLLILGIPVGILGARLYYVIFNWSWYITSEGTIDWLKIMNIRTGGLAIHGGLIFAFIAVAILCRKYHYHPADVLDAAVPGIALAQSIGRWGNFFNSEAHGGPTDLPWGIPVDGQMVHPTFLYESIWCFLLFVLLIYVGNRRKFTGQILLLYSGLYSIERFFVEGLRTDSLMLGSFRQAQLLSGAVIILSLIFYGILYHRWKKKDVEKEIEE